MKGAKIVCQISISQFINSSLHRECISHLIKQETIFTVLYGSFVMTSTEFQFQTHLLLCTISPDKNIVTSINVLDLLSF